MTTPAATAARAAANALLPPSPDPQCIHRAADGSFGFAVHDGDVSLELALADAQRVVSAVEPKRGNIRGAIRGTTISLRLTQSAHQFLSNDMSRSVVWYCDERDLQALKWALIEAREAAEFFA